MTQTAKHTPGPWVINSGCIVVAENGYDVASCGGFNSGFEAQEANAALIAAAPDMAEALRKLLLVDNKNYTSDSPMAVAFEQARRALEKAGV